MAVPPVVCVCLRSFSRWAVGGVVHSVAVAADQDKVPGVGWSVVFPVDDVVDFEAECCGAAGYAADVVVAVFNESADSVGHDVLCSADRDGWGSRLRRVLW